MQNWKDSGFFISATSSITGFATAAMLTFTYVIPVYQKQDENTIAELNKKINDLNVLHEGKLKSLRNKNDLQQKEMETLILKNTTLENENNDYKAHLLTLSIHSNFQHGQALPIGYSSILPGMKLSDVKKKYKKEKLEISPKGDYISVKIDAGGIERIEYSAGLEDVPDIISTILVFKYDLETSINGEVSKNKDEKLSLLNFLQENLGHKEECSPGQYIWRIDDLRYVFYNEEIPYFYQIFFNGIYAPGTLSKCLKLIHSS